VSAVAEPRPTDIEDRVRVARGRHAPPPEVRLPLQRKRLLRAALAEFSDRGYPAATAASIARRAQMSKATFYAHFANKEECILALYDDANEMVREAILRATDSVGMSDVATRFHAATRSYLNAVVANPKLTHVLVVEILAVGPKGVAKRDQAMQMFAELLDAENAAAARLGLSPRFASRHDAFAIVGAVTELVSRHVRGGVPRDLLELAPVIDRLIDGILARGST
jgi:AcrR family transcriptional regulator